MNKHYFLASLEYHLAPMPEPRRSEIVKEYEDYFAYGIQAGRAEEEILQELGDPVARASAILNKSWSTEYRPYSDARGGYADSTYDASDASQGTYSASPGYDAGPGYAAAPWSPPAPRSDFARKLGVLVLLGFLNMILLPIIASLWAALLGFGAGALGAIAAPLAAGLDWFMNGEFFPAKLFIAFGATGIGILMAVAFYYLAKAWIHVNSLYFKWNVHLWRGRN
ncbi:hypothetical protein J19TS2_24270 [Cohnella xylanilytica]|uniref:HAAS signaling domain-containing protein n=1 Tax=Cohnella xylanilytica TaxID=557555 RepID=UPI001B27F069|nr:DUF1700 domain-containing protein [Cohnella xylanilytica]GIO12872.1 hypothetical protein J19TS2_24270 [Cohnella xylanilytica]